MVAVVKIAFISVKHTSDSYLTQRAQLFMQSVVENAIMAIEGYERNSSSKCLKNIIFTDEDKRFEANVTVLRYYCYDLNDCPCPEAVKIETDKSHGYVLMKVTVETNSSNPKNGEKRIKITKTFLQRP